MSKSFREDLTGKRFGRLTVLEFVPTPDECSHWRCKCDCGNITTVWQSTLKNGNTKSCGCLSKEMARKKHITHGLRNTRLYGIWSQLKVRCYKQNSKIYKYYGGRGITVCGEWKSDFNAFYDWAMANGYSDELSIDRIDVNGNYEPNNCRWVDEKTQQRNRSNNTIVEYQARKVTLTEASELSGINFYVLRGRYNRGDRGERLFRPIKKKSK